MPRILHCADLHADPAWFDWVANRCVKYDLLILAGDLQNAFGSVPMREQARAISAWLISLRAPVAVIGGNHDFWVRDPRVSIDVTAEGGWIRNLRGKGNIIAVDGDALEFQGLTIACNGWLSVPDLDRSVDILVTHAGPSAAATSASSEGLDVSDPDLWPSLSYAPKILCVGHVHTPRAFSCKWPPIDPTTLILNPGFSETKVPAYWEIDTDQKTATHSTGKKVSYE
jgi:predicted phosphodiesterase